MIGITDEQGERLRPRYRSRETLSELRRTLIAWSKPPNDFELGTNDVHVWRVCLEQPLETVTSLRELLSPEERARADRFHFESDRQHFTVARGYLRTILARYLNMPATEVAFRYTDHGKPYLAEPEFELNFNLAHSGSLALYAFTRVGEVGVDLERIRPNVMREEIADRFFAASEVDCLNQLPTYARRRAFFDCWTRKEAFIKAKGMGLSLPLDQFEVAFAPAQAPAVLRTQWDEGEAARWSLQTIKLSDDYVGALAIEAQNLKLSYWDRDDVEFS